jgi:hypothetical protein
LTPTRHWSVARDIKRKHAGIGQPISQDLENKKEQACKELTDLVTLMAVYLNIEELNSAPLQPTLPFIVLNLGLNHLINYTMKRL